LEIEQKRKKHIITPNTFAVGVARVGSDAPIVKADFIKNLLKHDFGCPPHSLILLGQIHFMEAEALIAFAGAPDELRRLAK
jgi:diphthamide biosynthesis methyltransferase